jgi:hypothetical protein
MDITKDNTKLQSKIEKYHALVRAGKDASGLQAEIKAYTDLYLEKQNNALNEIRQSAKQAVIEVKDKKHPSLRKEYKLLIELYRKAIDIAKEISRYKKQLRGK